MSLEFRIKKNGKYIYGDGYVHLQPAISGAASMELAPGDVVQVIADSAEGERIVAEYKGDSRV